MMVKIAKGKEEGEGRDYTYKEGGNTMSLRKPTARVARSLEKSDEESVAVSSSALVPP